MLPGRQQPSWREREDGFSAAYHRPPAWQDDGLVQRLRQVIDTREAVTDCSQAMLRRTENLSHCVHTWKDVLQSAVADRAVDKALALLYVANDVLQCPHAGYRWKDEFGPTLRDVLPQALACAQLLRAYEVHEKMVRLPTIWRDRRVLRSDVAERLVENCYDSAQQLHGRDAPVARPRDWPANHERPPSQHDSHRPSHQPAPLPPPSHPAPSPSDHNRHQPPAPYHTPHADPSQDHARLTPPQAMPHHSQPQQHPHLSPSVGSAPWPQLCHNVPPHAPLNPPLSQIPSVAQFNSSAEQSHAGTVAPEPEEVAKQVALEQALFDIEQARGLLQMVKKTVLEGKLQVFEQTHANAKRALESKHAAALATCLSHIDLQRMNEVHQTEVGALESQHEEEAEHLRVKWVFELKTWGESVAMLCDRLRQQIPDAAWLSGLLRKANRAQRCAVTAVEMETFLVGYCANPDQVLLPETWNLSQPPLPPPDPPPPPEPYPACALQPGAQIPPPDGAQCSRQGDRQDGSMDMEIDMDVSREVEEVAGHVGGMVRSSKVNGRMENASQNGAVCDQGKLKRKDTDRKKKAQEEVLDESCPLYRCQGCDKVFVVRGMLSVADLNGLNAGTRRYVDSKTARAARDTHRRDAHPKLAASLDHPPAQRPRALEEMPAPPSSTALPLPTPHPPAPHNDSIGSVAGERATETAQGTTAEGGPGGPDLGTRWRGAAVPQNAAAAPKDPRLLRSGTGASSGPAPSQTSGAVGRLPAPDFIPAAAGGSRESMEGYVSKYGPSGPGYYRIVTALQVALFLC